MTTHSHKHVRGCICAIWLWCGQYLDHSLGEYCRDPAKSRLEGGRGSRRGHEGEGVGKGKSRAYVEEDEVKLSCCGGLPFSAHQPGRELKYRVSQTGNDDGQGTS